MIRPAIQSIIMIYIYKKSLKITLKFGLLFITNKMLNYKCIRIEELQMSRDHRQLNHQMIAYAAMCNQTEAHEVLGNMSL